MTIEVSEVLGAPAGSPANFPSMPTVGGDPVVESGSNSDGEWVRWADGTQQVRQVGASNLAMSGTFGNIHSSSLSSWTMPQAFTATPNASPSSRFGTSASVAWIMLREVTLTTVSYYTASAVADGGGIPSIVADGRWK